MPTDDLLGLSATQWRFLSNPQKYVEASKKSDRELLPESTQRQFLTARDILARLDGCCGEQARRGVLLADDVGLGKTTVAALVAWVVASAGKKRSVRILAPNDVMVRRWEEELLSHVELLNSCAPNLIDVNSKRVKGAVQRLHPGSIQVVKHSYASDNNLSCDLLIVDEAHRAKGEHTDFSKSLKRQKKSARRVLILTATPFSIRLEELKRMLTLVGAEHVHSAVGAYSRALDDLYTGSTARNPDVVVVAQRLTAKAKAAIEAISHYVIRHSIDDLPKEQKDLGLTEEWVISVPSATQDELELMLRMDRMLRVAKDDDAALSGATNDPRFHVGWQHFDSEMHAMREKVTRLREPNRALVEKQLHEIKRLRDKVGVHSKIDAVAKEIKSTINQNQGEKVVVFCHHHATARELTVRLASLLPKMSVSSAFDKPVWKDAWEKLLDPAGEELHAEMLRDTFIKWLCSDLIRAQTESWLGIIPKSAASLKNALERKHARHPRAETIAQAAQRLYHELLKSKSSKAVLRQAADDRLELLPGANGASRVLGVCEPSERDEEKSLFIHNQQPDTVISVFGSPFGPDVLVVTDKLSEGIDLHRYCRHLIHYELDPSPIRTVQRNGRIRRVNSWAAITGQKIRYAYPAFGGTRDHRLVQIMKKRIDSFSLLLGGVQDFVVEETSATDEKWRSEVINNAKKQLKKEGRELCAKKPGTE